MFNASISMDLLYSLLLMVHFKIVFGCPGNCTCKWKSGKEWVECSAHGLQDFPRGIREETQVLDLSNNELHDIKADSFFSQGLINLQRLYLRHSHICVIEKQAFSGLQGLVELDLSENKIKEIYSGTFYPVNNLMRLNLAANPIEVLSSNTFHNLSQLNFLDLSHCLISRIEKNAFTGLRSLEWLRLNNNLLKNIPESCLPLTSSLRGLTLHGNPWLCNCHLYALHSWLEVADDQISHELDPVCQEPTRLKKKLVRALKLSELACEPKVMTTDSLNLFEGENATLQCEIFAIPQSFPLWIFNGKHLNVDNKKLNTEKLKFRRNYTQEIFDSKIISTLQIFFVEPTDEGNYICQAENAAGKSSSNLTLVVLQNSIHTFQQSIENPNARFTAVLAAGILLGTLSALSCIFLIIFLYARYFHSNSLNNYIQKPPVSDLVPSSILKRSSTNLKNYSQSNSNNHCSAFNGFYFKNISSTHSIRTCFNNDNQITGDNETIGELELQRNTSQQWFMEPDLINKVPLNDTETTDRPFKVFSKYLDNDGYPLNFGLPKLVPMISQTYNSNKQNINHDQKYWVKSSGKFLRTNVQFEVDISTRNNNFSDALSSFKVDDTPNPSPTFAPSPPLAYRNDSVTKPNYLMSKGSHYRPIHLTDPSILLMNNSALYLQRSQKQSENQEIFEFSESPDEGYVGDVMDI